MLLWHRFVILKQHSLNKKFDFMRILYHKIFMRTIILSIGVPGGSYGKESACNVGDLGSIPGLGRLHGGGHGNTLQYSFLENSPWTEEIAELQPMG